MSACFSALLPILALVGASAPAMAQTASFLTTDTTTQGNWKGVYGSDGYVIANDSSVAPGYDSTVSTTGTPYTWYAAGSATADGDPRSLLSGAPGATLSTRIASTYYTATGNSFTISVNITDGQTHQVTLYLLDEDRQGRTESITVSNANTNAVLNTVNASGFGNGVYYAWSVSGDVTFTVTNTNPSSDAVVSGIFFGTAAPTTITITSPAPGNVSGVIALSANATAAVGVASVQFQLDGSNIASAVTGTGPTYTTSWNSATAPSNGSHTITAIVTDNLGRTTTSAGVQVTISGAGPPQPEATYLQTVSTPPASGNMGDWQVRYGQDGYLIPNQPNNLTPPYATITALGSSGIAPAAYAYLDTLPADVNDSRAMQWAGCSGNPPTGASCTAPTSLGNGAYTAQNPPRNPSVYYDQTSMTVSINITDGNSHQIAIYALDFDSSARAETISILNGNTGAVLASQSITSFHAGEYLLFSVKGYVKVQITNNNAGDNIVFSGIYFGGGVPAPSVSVTNPPSGPVSGIETVTATATSNGSTIASVQFQLDGVNLGSLVTTSPYQVPWNTATAISGSHALSAIATDALGQSTTSAGVTVTVNNPAPSVSFTNPAANSTVLGTITVSANAASTNDAITSVQFQVDGASLGTVTVAPYQVQWNTNGVVNGTHTLTAIATDTLGQTTTITESIKVSNGGPNVSLTSPPAGAATGTITVTATTSQTNAPVASVQFTIDNNNLGALQQGSGPTFSISLDTTTLTTGNHTLRAIATDNLGQSTTSAGVVIAVNNPPPTISITSPAGGATIVGSISISANAASPTAKLASVQFKLDGNNLGAALTASGSNYTATTLWASTTANNGSHTLTAVVTDSLNQTTTSAGVTITVQNPPPVISITSPTGGTVSGALTVQATATSTIGMASVQFKLDGANLGSAVNGPGPGYSTPWFTGSATNGTHVLSAVATDTQGQTTTSSSVTVTVSNTPPSITITSPTASATLLGTVSLTATATSSTSTIASVQFQVDGKNIGNPITSGSGSTYTTSWNTGTITNGPHSVTAIATDAIGITQTSAAVSVTVNNPPPTISITSPTGTFSLVGTVTVTANAASAIGLASVQFQLDGTNLGALVTGTGPTFSTQWITNTVANGSHVLTAIAKDTQNQTTTSAAVTVNVSNGPPPPPSAVFLSTDTKTQGNWPGVYGSDGYVIPNDANVIPTYATLTSSGANPYTWVSPTTDVRAPYTTPTATTRIASAFYTSTSFSFNLNFTDGQVHRMALYALDFETTSRAETVSILNGNTNAVLNSQTLSNFNGGTYALWNLQGNVIVQVTYTGGLNAVVSGLFFDTPLPPPPPPTVSLISPTPGTISGTVTVSANATSAASIASVQFQVDGKNLGSPVTGAGPIYSYTWNTATITNGAHLLTAIATDTLNQTTTSAPVTVTTSNTVAPPVISITAPAAGTVNTTVTVTANATAVAGLASVQFLLDGGNLGALQTGSGPAFSIQWNSINTTNGVHTLSAVATDELGQTTTATGVVVTVNNVTPSATFIKLDSTTQGSWTGIYGADGFIIPNDASNPPAYAVVSGPGAAGPPYTWAASTTSSSALLTGPSQTSRIASTWYTAANSTPFSFNINLTDGLTHQLALYCWDFGGGNRVESITFQNANTNALLASQAMSNFTNGVYAVFNVTGNVIVTINYTSGLNAVLSGLFFSTVAAPPAPPLVSVTTPTAGSTVQGTITVSANATAGAGMASVQFQVDGKNVGAAITGAGPVFNGQWNTSTGTNGTHVVTAIATDTLGQTTTSAGVSVTVTNPITPPVISITNPVPGPVAGTITVTANATAVAGMAQVQFQLDGSNLGAAVTGAGPTYNYTWNTTTATNGAHVLTAIATDNDSQTTTSGTVNVTVANVAPSATFIKTDAVTLGSWVGVYGADGYMIPNDANSPPSYATVAAPTNATAYTWTAVTTSTSGLLMSPSSVSRIASTWYSTSNGTPMVFDINLTDGQTHQIALYLWDLENSGRAETITFTNASTGAVLATKAMSSFANGVYAVFNVTGHVQAQFTWTAGINAVVSGIFFSTVVPPPPPPSVSITTPSPGATVTGTIALGATAASSVGLASVQFKLDGNNIGAAVTGAGPTFVAQWNSATTSNGSHTLTAVATDTTGQSTTSGGVTVTTQNTVAHPVISITAPAAGAVSGTVTITANATAAAGMASVQFQLDGSALGSPVTGTGPTYSYTWNTGTLTGAHTLTAVATDDVGQTTTSAGVAITVTNVGPSATFIKLDTVTQGTWNGVYGGDGYLIATETAAAPAYATVVLPTSATGPTYVWAASSTDVRALQVGVAQTTRIASTWYSQSNSTPFIYDINLTDGQTHQLALYALDFEGAGRAENIAILNASTGAVLVNQPVTSFGNGVWAVFSVTGHIQVRVTWTSGINAVLSGLFFATPIPPPPPPTISLTSPTAGSSLSGTVNINATATASAPDTMASVQFQIDGANLGTPVTGAGPGFTIAWNTATTANGTHSLTAIATDSAGETTTSAAVSVTLSNIVAPPVISITAPAAGTVSGTVTVTANATATAGMKQVQFLLDGSDLGSAVAGAGPTFTYQWNTVALTGSHTLTAVATDNAGNTMTSAAVTVTVSNVGPSATFIKTDTVTMGNWVGVYGADGFLIPLDSSSALPAYATVTPPSASTGPTYTWLSSTTNASGLLSGPGTTSRIATTYYSANNSVPYVFNINLTDGKTHQIALYAWDLENSGRAETFTFINPINNAVLASKEISSFATGAYAVFNVSGNVELQVSYDAGINAVLSGLFFSTVLPPPPPPTISITAPAGGSTQSGTVTITASAAANAPDTMASVQFLVDGSNLGAAVTGAGPTFTTQWNTTTFSNGSHSLTAVATDSLGETTTSAAVTVSTQNTVAPPIISITTPAAGPVSGTVTVTANATAVAGMKQVQFQLDGSNLGAAVTGAGPTFTYQWSTTSVNGAHVLTAIATDNDNQTTTSASVSVTVSNVVSSATFVKTDSVTLGNWVGVYGSDGYIIPADATTPPGYATVTGPGAAGPTYVWASSSTSQSAPLLGPSTTARIASTYYTTTSFSINIDLTDGKTHQLALYLWDLDNSGRAETLNILNPANNTVLATKSMSSFANGVYAVFNITGNVTLQVVYNAGTNAVLSGLYFSTLAGPPAVSITAPPPSTTQSGTISVTANATAQSPNTMASVQFQVDGNNIGTAVTGTGPAFTTQWNTATVTNGSHTLTAIATDNLGQTTTSSSVSITTTNVAAPPVISITAPAAGTVSGTVTVTANATAVAGIKSVQFLLDGANLGSAQTGAGPSYSVQWNTTGVSGSHTLSATAIDNDNQTTTSAGVNVTISNLGPSATFIKLDSATQGNWVGVYGGDGFDIAVDSNSTTPSYAVVTPPSITTGPTYTWLASTTNVDALLISPTSTSRTATTWYSASNSVPYVFDINLTDGQTHQIALYAWDLENSGRKETINILNAGTGAVLATQTISSFQNGVYAVFNVSGHVQVQVNYIAGINAVLSGLFFATPAPPPPPPSISITAPAASSTLSGTVNFTASAVASAPDTMASVQFRVDGVNLGSPATGAGPTFTTQWNTTNFSNGTHSLTAIATDSLGEQTTSAAISVTTSNTAAPPVVSITAPTPGVVSGTVTVTADATGVAGIKSVQFQLDGASLGAAVTGAGPAYSYQWSTTGLTGTHTLTAIATDNDNQTTTSAGVSVTISAGPAAAFVRTDSTTLGNWGGVYGADGYIIANDPPNVIPSYAVVTLPSTSTGPQYTWAASTTSPSGLLTAPSATTRIASTFYSATNSVPFVFDINLTDGQTHALALYLWDLENSGRAETINILNASTGAVLATKSMSSFGSGVYAVFNMSGHVQVQFVWTAGINAVVSGLFFSTPPPLPPPPSINLTAPTAASTQSGTINITASAAANSPATMASVQFQVDGTNLGSPVTGAGPTFTMQWNTATVSNGSHVLTAIATDSDNQTTTSSQVTITTSNTTITGPAISITAPTGGSVSGIVTVTANATSPNGMSSVQFKLDGATLGGVQAGAGPTYSVQWNTAGLSGTHSLTAVATDDDMLTATSAPVSVTIASTSASAYLVKEDTTTQGTWPGVYGADGYVIPNDASAPPAYATVTLGSGAAPYTWEASTTDVRALEVSPTNSNRMASAWYSGSSSFNINVNLSDGNLHQLAVYALDFDTTTRNETISILDAASNSVLVTQTLTSFNSGIWLVFNVKGNVIVQVTNNGGQPNIVLSGVFFRSFSTVSPPQVSVTAPASGATVSGPITLTANATSAQGIASVQFQIDGVNQGSPQTGAGPSYSIQWASPLVANGVHTVTAIATDTLGLSTTSVAVSISVANGPPPANSAVFTGTDTTTQGSWPGNYGSDGYMIADGGPSPSPGPAGLPLVISYPPFYALVNLDGALQWTWHDGYPGTGAFTLPISPTSTTTIGAAYYQNFNYPAPAAGNLPLDVDVTFADNLTHQLSLYFVDWHHDIRTQQINIVDPNTQTVLSSQTITNFDAGIYLKYNVQGHVQVQVTLIVTPTNVTDDSIATSVVMAAMFFDPVP